jgi:hypothetical protein
MELTRRQSLGTRLTVPPESVASDHRPMVADLSFRP